MTNGHYNLYYIFLREKENCSPCKKKKNRALKKVLEIFEKSKTKGKIEYSYNQKDRSSKNKKKEELK